MKIRLGMLFILTCWTAAGRAAPDLLLPGNLKILGCSAPDTKHMFVRSSQPGNVFYPGDAVDLTIKVTRDAEPLRSVTLEVIEIAMRQDKYHEGWSVMSAPVAVQNLGSRGKVEVPVTIEDKPGATAEIEAQRLPVPNRYGSYLVTLAPNGRQPQFLCTLLRAHRPKEGFDVSAPVFGEGQFMTHDNGKPEMVRQRAQTLGRLGIKGVRIELGWSQDENGPYRWERFDSYMNSLKEAKVKTLVTMGGHPGWTMPFGQPTPACSQEDKPDHSCMPKYYDAFGRFIRAFCQRYWDGGNGSLWAIEHWNEPWEGISISGWESDSNHYRALMKQIADNCRAVDPRIRTAAACSMTNTGDKFLVGENRAEMIKLVDVFTDHYVPPRTCYGPMVAKHWGKENTDTESWIASNELLLPQVMCQFLASGQDRVTPWHPAMTYFSVPGSPMTFQMPNPVALATNVFNVFCTGKPFQRLLFLDHLPWAFQFGTGSEAAVVLLPRVMPFFGQGREDVLWWQFNVDEGGQLAIDNADSAIEFFDVAGNREFEGQKQVKVPMDYLAHYLRAPRGGVDLIAKRLAAARFEGVRPVEIIARDLTSPVDARGASVRVTLHNLMNRPVEGTLSLVAPDGMTLKEPRQTVSLAPGRSKDLEFLIAAARPSPANAYPMSYGFQSDAGRAAWKETLHVVCARKGTKQIDGDLADWDKDLGVPVQAAKQKVDPTSQAWLPFAGFQDAQPDGSFAEVKLAWDEQFLYVGARVNDPTDSPGHQRLETRDENQYFRSAKDDAICESLRPYEKLLRFHPRNPKEMEQARKAPQWAEFQKVLDRDPEAMEAWKSRAAAVYFEAKRRNPKASYADATHVYKKVPWTEFPWSGDTLQFAFDALPGYVHHDMKTDEDRVPVGFHSMPDVDYEFAAYQCTDGKSELWRLLAPGIPRGHYYPRQPRAKFDQGPVREGKHVVRRQGMVTTYELAIPWSELKQWLPRAGQLFGFTFRVNNNKGPALLFGAGKSTVKSNGLSLHPYWEGKPGCGVQWTLGE